MSEITRGGHFEAWVSRLRSGLLGENPKNPNTWVKDALYMNACSEAVRMSTSTGNGRQA